MLRFGFQLVNSLSGAYSYIILHCEAVWSLSVLGCAMSVAAGDSPSISCCARAKGGEGGRGDFLAGETEDCATNKDTSRSANTRTNALAQ
jgi:hypothetical protein